MNKFGFLYLSGTTLFTVYAQLMLKWRVATYGQLPSETTEKIRLILSMLIDPWMISAFASAFLSALFWMAAMTQMNVSYAYPLVTGAMIGITVLLSIIILKETITTAEILGIILIIIGIAIVATKKTNV